MFTGQQATVEPMIPTHQFSDRMFLEPEGVLHNMSVPPRTEIHIELKEVYEITVISLSRCLVLNGLIPGKRPISEAKAVLGQERNSAKRLAKLGCTLDEVEKAGESVRGVYIGAWFPNSQYKEGRIDLARRRVCADLPLSLMLLSHRIGNLYLSQRPPDFSPEHLVAGEWQWDDPRVISAANRCVSGKHKPASRIVRAKGGHR
mgnify:CR=1 FL=1